MAKIAYTNKVTASTIAAAEINKITAANMNEIKISVNVNVDDIAAEIINRASADTALQNNIDAEATSRENADVLKANIANPTFTGTVGGITKAMVGLGNVDNTSDASKPVSTLQATALALKLDKTSVDSVPTKNSTNAISSGSVYKENKEIKQDLNSFFTPELSLISIKTALDVEGYLNKSNGQVIAVGGNTFRATGFFTLIDGVKYNVKIKNDNSNVAAVYYYESNETFISVQIPDNTNEVQVDLIVPLNAQKVRFSYRTNLIFEFKKYILNPTNEINGKDVNLRLFSSDLIKLTPTLIEGYVAKTDVTPQSSSSWNFTIIDLTSETRQLYIDAGGNVSNTNISLAVYTDDALNILGTQGDSDSTDRPTSKKMKLVYPDGSTKAYIVGSKASQLLYGNLSVYAENIAVNKTIKKAANFYHAFGDSITQGIGSTGNANSYSNIFANLANLSKYNNRGISSAMVTLASASTNTNLLLYSRTKLITGVDGIITVAIGVNDFNAQNPAGLNADNPLGDVRVTAKKSLSSINGIETYSATYTFADAFRFTMETLKNDNPNAKIFCLLPINSNNEWQGTDADFPLKLQDFRDIEKDTCKFLGIEVVEMQFCGITSTNLTLYMPDGLHPNDYGHTAMANYLLKKINY